MSFVFLTLSLSLSSLSLCLPYLTSPLLFLSLSLSQVFQGFLHLAACHASSEYRPEDTQLVIDDDVAPGRVVVRDWRALCEANTQLVAGLESLEQYDKIGFCDGCAAILAPHSSRHACAACDWWMVQGEN